MSYESIIIINSDGELENTLDKSSVIAKYLSSLAGKQSLALSMMQPLKTRLDYQNIGRKTFLVEQLPTGILPIYDKDPNES